MHWAEGACCGNCYNGMSVSHQRHLLENNISVPVEMKKQWLQNFSDKRNYITCCESPQVLATGLHLPEFNWCAKHQPLKKKKRK